LSLTFIHRFTPDVHSAIADVGGGASTLVDNLLRAGYNNVMVLDVSAAALRQARKRLGDAATQVSWREANVMDPVLPERSIDFWHDRAVFHFLTNPYDRAQYVQQVRRVLRPGGYALIATFAEDGPQRCSGLEVVRYGVSELQAQFGEGFLLVAAEREDHPTPTGVHQAFQYCLFRSVP
jgi:ubiquinone/menaquinone biosynthesis C-methylase UbiE